MNLKTELVGLELYGVPEFTEAVTRLKPDRPTMRRIIIDSLDEATQPILDTMRSLCPIDTGALKASLGRRDRVLRSGRIYFTVLGPRANWRKGASNLPPTRYVHMVEFGVPARGIPARSFIRAAWDLHKATFPADFLARVMARLAAM